MKVEVCPICSYAPITKQERIPRYEPAVAISIRCSNGKCPLSKLPIMSDTIYHKYNKAINIVNNKWNKQYKDIKRLLEENCGKDI